MPHLVRYFYKSSLWIEILFSLQILTTKCFLLKFIILLYLKKVGNYHYNIINTIIITLITMVDGLLLCMLRGIILTKFLMIFQ